MYEYKMVQVPPNLLVGAKQANTAAADFVQNLANTNAVDGWEFFRIDTMGVGVPRGCLSTGQDVSQYYVVTFRRPKASQSNFGA